MKKHFFLFTVAFEVCLIASSSSSYGMDPELDEANKSIVLYNSQGQKTRKISLHGKDLTSDLKLHPAKGETLWFEEKQLACHHSYLDGKVYSFSYPEFAEITLSYPAWHGDLLSVAYKLSAYNIEKVGIPSIGKIMKASYKNSEGKSVVSFEGGRTEHSLTFCFDPEEVSESPKEFCSLLRALQNGAREEGVHMMHTNFFPAQKIPLGLYEEGFRSMGEIISFRGGKRITAYYKILHSDLDVDENDSHVTIEWKADDDTFSPPDYGSCFGLFIRDNKGAIQGGISGSIYPEAAFPFSEIETFYVDESLRGTGIGKKIFLMAEVFSKENGARFVQLDTTDYQAPWFYSKMGYTPVITEYESEKTVDGKWVNGYLFRKEL